MNNIAIIFAVIGILISLGFIYFLYDLRKRFFALFRKDVPKTHDKVIADALTRIKRLEEEKESLEARLKEAEQIGGRSFHKVGFLRFNPFQDTGGDQSFAVALLDSEDNGIIISSLYGREGTRVYGKIVDRGVPKQPISEEEEEVLKRAILKT